MYHPQIFHLILFNSQMFDTPSLFYSLGNRCKKGELPKVRELGNGGTLARAKILRLYTTHTSHPLINGLKNKSRHWQNKIN